MAGGPAGQSWLSKEKRQGTGTSWVGVAVCVRVCEAVGELDCETDVESNGADAFWAAASPRNTNANAERISSARREPPKSRNPRRGVAVAKPRRAPLIRMLSCPAAGVCCFSSRGRGSRLEPSALHESHDLSFPLKRLLFRASDLRIACCACITKHTLSLSSTPTPRWACTVLLRNRTSPTSWCSLRACSRGRCTCTHSTWGPNWSVQ